jgi:hypothetical protein
MATCKMLLAGTAQLESSSYRAVLGTLPSGLPVAHSTLQLGRSEPQGHRICGSCEFPPAS